MAFEFRIDLVGSAIHSSFSGEMTLGEAEKAIVRFEQVVPASGDFEFHAHLGGLARYDAGAREAWTRVLGKHRARCSKIVIYGARPIIRMAAATVALIVRLPMEFKDEPDH